MGEMPSIDHEGTRILPETVRIQRGTEGRERLATGEIYKLSDVKHHFEEQKVLAVDYPDQEAQFDAILGFSAGDDSNPLEHAKLVYERYSNEHSSLGEYARSASALAGLEHDDPRIAVGELERSIQDTVQYISKWEQKVQKIPMGRMPGDDVFARLEKEHQELLNQKEKLAMATDQSALPQAGQVEQKIQAVEQQLFNFEGGFLDAREREQPMRGLVLGNLESFRETVARETGYRAALQREYPQVYPQPLPPIPVK